MRSVVKGFFVLLMIAVVSGCASSPTISDYAREQPKLDLQRYFTGTVDGWGTVQDRSGRVTRRFVVEIRCRWEGNVGTLDERFVWSDGETETRVWTIRKEGDRYTGSAGDVVGVAQGEAAGSALRWAYVLKLPQKLGGYEVDMDDWMWLIDDRTLANQTTIRKFGIKFGEINISFRRRA